MLRRNLRHMRRYPSLTLFIAGTPIVLLLLFVYVFGDLASLLLPFLGSGVVPTDSMPAGLRWFAEHQPFTPADETLRGLLTGTHIGSSAVTACAWCAAIALLSYVWAKRLYNRP